MMTLGQAIAYGKRIGVKYYLKNEHGCIIGGTTTHEAAVAMMKEKTREGGYGTLHIEPAKEV